MLVALVLVTLTGAIAGRVNGAAMAAAAAAERAEARSLAEYALREALLVLDGTMGTEAGHASPEARLVLARDAASRMVDQFAPGAGRSIEVHVAPGVGGSYDVVVTATVAAQSASASASVRARITSDDLVLTEHRAIDPTLLRLARAGCSWPPGDPRRAPGCIDSDIVGGVLDGPVHSNEVLGFADGTSLASSASTSAASSDAPDADGTPVGVFPLEHRSELTLPRDARSVAVQAGVTCRFRGPTSLRLDGSSVRVRSPRSLPRDDDPDVGDGVIGCLGVDRSQLAGYVDVSLPAQAVIEVVRDPRSDCVDHPLGLSLGEDSEREWWCGGGDAFVWGRYHGARTIVAEDNIQIVWDVEPSPGEPTPDGQSAPAGLGLIAGDSIVLRRPVGPPIRRIAPYGRNLPSAGPGIPPFGDHPDDAPTSEPTTWEAPRIVAAMVALRGSVSIQNPFRGERHTGALTIRGSIVGRFSGVLGWEHRSPTGALLGATGYTPDLRYDPALALTPPPGMPRLDGGGLRVLELDVG